MKKWLYLYDITLILCAVFFITFAVTSETLSGQARLILAGASAVSFVMLLIRKS